MANSHFRKSDLSTSPWRERPTLWSDELIIQVLLPLVVTRTRLTVSPSNRIMTIGAPEFFGPQVKEHILQVAEKVERSELFEECGHSLALEKPERLAKCLREFMLGQK